MHGRQAYILCVDDEPMNLRLLEAMLLPRGYLVATAQDGAAALEKIRTEPVDIVLLDVMMPEMDGFEVCRRIKSEEAFRNIPVVMITAYSARENRIRGIEAGAEDFIAKPFDSAEILARVAMLLRVKGLNDQLDNAFNNITSLISFGEQLTANFDPLHFDFLTSITAVVRQIIALAQQDEHHPQRVLVAHCEADGTWTGHLFGSVAGALTEAPFTSPLGSLLRDLVPRSGGVWLNRSDLQGERYRDLVAALHAHGIIPANLVCHLSRQISLCAINYGREVTRFDAEVLNSVVAQSLFLNSLARQVTETEEAFAYTIHALARAAEVNDDDTGDHILRVGDYCALLARQLGMNEEFINLIHHQSIMHDVGKIHLPPSILKKPGRLEPEEFELVKLHPVHGATIIGDHVRLGLARSIALTHHERFDGSGYPYGLCGEQIPIEGRILNLADQYDAMRNARCYKPAIDHETTCRIIIDGDGRTRPQHFDPRVLAAFKEIHGRFAEVFAARQDRHGASGAPLEPA